MIRLRLRSAAWRIASMHDSAASSLPRPMADFGARTYASRFASKPPASNLRRSTSAGIHLGYVLRRFPQLSESFVLNEIRALESLGHRVTVFSQFDPGLQHHALVSADQGRSVYYLEPIACGGLFQALGAALLSQPRRLLNTLRQVLRARNPRHWTALRHALVLSRLLHSHSTDHLHAHLSFGSDVAWLTSALTGLGFSFTAHARDVYVRNADLPAKLAAARFVVTVCEYNRIRLSRMQPRCADRIEVLHPFLSRELFLSDVAAPTQLNEGQPSRLITICRLVPKKGVDVLLDAMHRLARADQRLHLTIIGDGRERQHLEQQVCALGLNEMVSFEGAVDAAQVRRTLLIADCLVLAAVVTPDGDSDATPAVLGEAMALGLPVISTRVAGIPEIVPEGAGLLVQPGDAEALADAIAAIGKLSPEARRAMGEVGRAFVHAHWNPDLDAPRLALLFARGKVDRS